MLQNKQPRDYVIATGKTNTIEDFLKISFEIIGINNWEDYVLQNPKYLRPAEVDYLKGDASKPNGIKLETKTKFCRSS